MATKVLGTLGNIDTLSIGGRTLTDLTSNLIVLIAYTATAGRYTTFRKIGAAAGYQVTTGKTLTVVAARCFIASAATGSVYFLYGDTDVGGNVPGAPTTPKYPFDTQASSGILNDGLGNKISDTAPFFTVPALKYPAINSAPGGDVMVTIWCYEA